MLQNANKIICHFLYNHIMDKTQIRYLLDKKPEEIIAYFKAKGIHPTWNWQDLWQESSMKAFTVTKVMEMDILQDIKNELVNALESGETLQTFKNNLESVLADKEWWKVKKTQTNPDTGETAEVELGSNRRLKQIYETNLTTSYRSGQFKQQWESRDTRPYWMYVCKMLPTSREEHKALNGKVFLATDPFWDTFYPPNGFNCRCDVIPLTDDEVNSLDHWTYQPKTDENGQQIVKNGIPQYERVKTKIERCQSDSSNLKYKDATATVNGRKMTYKKAVYIDPKTGVATSTDRGWNYNPGKAVYFEPDLSKYDDIFVKKYLEMKKEFDERLFNIVQDKKSLIKTVVTKKIQKEVAHKIKDYVYLDKKTNQGNEYYVSEIREKSGNQNPDETKKLKKEMWQAKLLADNGHKVYLIAEDNSKGLNYDAIVDDVKFEFKRIDGNWGKIQRHSAKGIKQAGNVFVAITRNHSYDVVHKYVYEAFKNSASHESIFIVYLAKTKKFYYWHFTK